MSFFKSTLFVLIFFVSSKVHSQDYSKLSMHYYKNTSEENITFLKNKIEKSNAENLVINLLDKYESIKNLTLSFEKSQQKIKRDFKYDYPDPKNSTACKNFEYNNKKTESENSRANSLKIMLNTAKITLNLCKNNIYNKTGCAQQRNNYNTQVRLYNQAISNAQSYYNRAENYQESCNRNIKTFKKNSEMVNSKLISMHRKYSNEHKTLSNEIFLLDTKVRNILNN